MTYSRRTWVNGNQWDQTAANDFEGRIEAEFGVKATEIAARASQTSLNTTNSDVAALDTRLDTVEALVSATSAGSVLPGSPVDGQELFYIADSTNGVIWHLRYRSASSSAYKWEFVGGGTLSAEVLASATIPAAQTTYGDISGSTGPSLAVPLAGDYLVAVESYVAGAIGQQVMVSYAVGATAANDSDGAELTIGGSTPSGTDIRANVRRSRLKTITAAATTLTAKYRTSNAAFGAPTVAERVLTVIPIRVG